MIVSKKHLDRRTFLRGASTVLALPLLDAMIPALRPERLTAAMPVRRLGFVMYPLGVVVDKWKPAGTPSFYIIDPEGVIRYKWAGAPGAKAIDAA